MKIKGFIEVTETKNLKKHLIKIDEIKLIDDGKIFVFNVYIEVIEKYEEIINKIKEAIN